MSKRDSRGKQVKSFQAWIPQPSLKREKVVVAVYFQATNGAFSVELPEHIVSMIEPAKYGDGGARLSDRLLTSNTMDAVIGAHQSALHRYEELMRQNTKRKVISFKMECNAVYREGWIHHRADDISFCGRPALFLDFCVLYEAGGQLYQLDEEDRLLHRASGWSDGTIIDWTEEREKFFSEMLKGLCGAIERLVEFEIALKQNPGAAIASLMGSGRLLPAPAPEKVAKKRGANG